MTFYADPYATLYRGDALIVDGHRKPAMLNGRRQPFCNRD